MRTEYPEEKVCIIPSIKEHIAPIAERMCLEDRQEVYLGFGYSALTALTTSFDRSSKVYTLLQDGRPELMIGVAPCSLISDNAIVWLLSTGEIQKIKLKFTRGSVGMLKDLSQGFTKLENYVYAKNKQSIRWLKYLGFTFEETIPFGIYQQPFMHFYKKF